MDTIDMDALANRVKARRAAKGLVAKDGVHCATLEQKAYHDLRYRLKQRSDWGNLPPDLYDELVSAKKAAQ